MSSSWHRHAWTNRLQSVLLVLTLIGISTLAGVLLFGDEGLWVAAGIALVALLLEPAAASTLTLRLYRAQMVPPAAAPQLWQMLRRLAERAGLPALPLLYYVPSPVVNAFAVGNREQSAIAVTDGLLRRLDSRELAGVLAHELAHIAHGDLRVMGLADYVSRLTSVFALLGQLVLLLMLPWVLSGSAEINWLGLFVLAGSPLLALLAQLGLSRVREFDADLTAAQLTGDPAGLASALAKIEHLGRSWRRVLMPGWGNPQPSWLRTHPATEERIARLQTLPQAAEYSAWPAWRHEGFGAPVPRAPRWRVGGLWR